jgi:hypothetical protein
VFRESLNGAALARRVATLEQDYVSGAGALAVVLQLQQLDLQSPLQVLVFVARHPVVVGITLAPRLHVIAVAVEQDRIVVIVVVDRVPMIRSGQGLEIYLRHVFLLCQAAAGWQG